jgi:hypothetical protein
MSNVSGAQWKPCKQCATATYTKDFGRYAQASYPCSASTLICLSTTLMLRASFTSASEPLIERSPVSEICR